MWMPSGGQATRGSKLSYHVKASQALNLNGDGRLGLSPPNAEPPPDAHSAILWRSF